MTKFTRIALAFAGVAALGATGAHADWRGHKEGRGMHGAMIMESFKKADADESGDVTLEEFEAAVNARLSSIDTDGDKKISVAEVAAEIERIRAERMARRVISRFDANDDGELTVDEVQNRSAKLFAFVDRNDDGKVEEKELRRGGKYRGMHREHRGMRDDHHGMHHEYRHDDHRGRHHEHHDDE